MQTLQEKSEVREQRAKAILEFGTPQALDAFTYLVPSQFDSGKRYRVVHVDSYSCQCEDFNRRCKGSGLYCITKRNSRKSGVGLMRFRITLMGLRYFTIL